MPLILTLCPYAHHYHKPEGNQTTNMLVMVDELEMVCGFQD
jgi:hypothetical protein